MGFSYNDITSKSMGLKARLTSWQVSGSLRNFTTTVPGKYGVTDFGADFDYWANQAAYRWKLRGMCMWSLGQEDMRLWEWLPKQI